MAVGERIQNMFGCEMENGRFAVYVIVVNDKRVISK